MSEVTMTGGRAMTDAPELLLSCPFCGGRPEPVRDCGPRADKYLIICGDCLASTDLKEAAIDAIDAWNRRHPMVVEEGDVSELPEELRPGRKVI